MTTLRKRKVTKAWAVMSGPNESRSFKILTEKNGRLIVFEDWSSAALSTTRRLCQVEIRELAKPRRRKGEKG